MARSNGEGRDGKSSVARSAGRGESVGRSKQGLLGAERGAIVSRKGLDQAQMRRFKVELGRARLG